MSRMGVAVAAIECPNCSKLALFEGCLMATLARPGLISAVLMPSIKGNLLVEKTSPKLAVIQT